MDECLNAPAEIRTRRLILRKPKLEDAGPLFEAYASDRTVVKYMIWHVHDTQEETHAYLCRCLDEWATGVGYPYVIEIDDGPVGPVGMIHLHRHSHSAELGYVIARPYWGRGYMTEALSALVDWSLDQPEIWRASAVCDIDNLASARVMEKSGMAFEGIVRRFLVHPNISPEPRDCRVFAKVKS